MKVPTASQPSEHGGFALPGATSVTQMGLSGYFWWKVVISEMTVAESGWYLWMLYAEKKFLQLHAA